jgi:hypothetical protein
MSDRRRDEKEEEKREKEDEKRSEKVWEEKWQHNPVRIITLAAVLIWGGIVALLETSRIVKTSWWNGWAVFLAGVGVILLIKAAFRRSSPEHRRPVGGTVIIGLILLAVGLASIIGWSFGWPVILIAIGIIIVILTLFRRR